LIEQSCTYDRRRSSFQHNAIASAILAAIPAGRAK